MPADLDRLEELTRHPEAFGAADLLDLGSAVSELRELRARPSLAPYTRVKPTAPGWYWVRDDFDRETNRPGEVVYLGIGTEDEEGNPVLWTDEGHDLDPEWDYSPIPEPPRGGPRMAINHLP